MNDDIGKLSDQELVDRYADLYGFLAFHKIEPPQEFLDLANEVARRGLPCLHSGLSNRANRRAHARKLRKN